MEIPETRKKVDLRSHLEMTQDDGQVTLRFPLLDVSAAGATEEDAFNAIVSSIREKVSGDESLQGTWNDFLAANTKEVPIPIEERAEMQSVVERSKEASKGFRAVTAADFDDAIASDTPTLVDVWADWCMPCHMLAPMLKELADEWGERIEVVKLNGDDERAVVDRLNIRGFPTMLLFKSGDEVHRVVGTPPGKDALRAELEPHL